MKRAGIAIGTPALAALGSLALGGFLYASVMVPALEPVAAARPLR
ncbi:MAG TPA: hypothetical protein VL241_10815 [Gemmatimonadales bacterium]|nr:hypothetical protein [Gemmatimonadales bacterium]